MSTATTGTGTITLGSAVQPFLTFALAGVADGDVVSYSIIDGTAASEIGTGTYTSAGTTLTRTVTKSTNANAAINLSGAAQVLISARAEDFPFLAAGKSLAVNNSLTLSGTDSTTVTFQATDTYVGRATTDTLTNKTFDTAGTGNSFSINGVAATANTGTGSVVRATSPALVTPALGVATATSVAASGVLSTGTNSGTNGQVTLSGSTSGSCTLKVAAAAGTATNFQLPTANGTNLYLLQTDGSGNTSWVAPPAAAGLSSKALNFTRNLTTASGSVGYTGFGFTPTSLIITIVGKNGTTSNGSCTSYVDSGRGVAAVHIGVDNNPSFGQTALTVIGAADGFTSPATTGQTATVTSFDADGFTLSWTKNGSPIDTSAKMSVIAFK